MKEIKSKLLIIFLVWFLIMILFNSSLVVDVVLTSVTIFKNNIFPTLFPFFVISDLLISLNFVSIISPILNKFLKPLFHTSSNSNYIFLMSMLSGFPSNSKIAKSLLDNNMITVEEVEHVLCFSHFSNPLFILGTLTVFLNSKKMGFIILIIHYLSNFIIGFLRRNKVVIKTENSNFINKNSKPFGTILGEAISNAIQSLLLILGTLTTFMLVSAIILKVVYITEPYATILRGILEMTQGLKYTSLLVLPLSFKALISLAFLSFGGFSIHIQVMSILNNPDIHYLPYLKARILHVLISTSLLYLVYNFV